MQLFYNDVPLHALGVIRVAEQGEEMQPDELPQRKRITLRVRLDTFADFDFNANRALIGQVRTALKTQNGVLLWQDEISGAIYVNQTATVLATNFPEENNWGTHHQVIEFSFAYWDHELQTGAMDLTFQKTGATGVISIGHVYTWRESYAAQRYSPLRSQRSQGNGKINATGQFLGNPLDTVANRRIDLFAQMEELRGAVNGADGTLIYGADKFNRVVRIDEFDCEINQAVTAINWSLGASFTHFPNEAGYALAEFELRTREDNENGAVVISFSGRIGAQSQTAALAKLAALRTSFIPALAGGISYAQTHSEISTPYVHADTDGEMFLEIHFDEEYRKAKSSIVSESLRLADQEDVKSGLIRRTYSGTVTAYATTWDTAYQAATNRARQLGDNKAQFKLNGSITASDNQQTAYAVLTGTARFVTVEFSFEYQLKGEHVYLELTAETTTETFGVNQQSVQGFVIASTLTAARTIYDTVIKPAYEVQSGVRQLIRSERISTSTQKIGSDAHAPIGGMRSPPNSTSSFGTLVNTAETVTASYATIGIRLEFNFTVAVPKVNGGGIALKYSLEIVKDYKERKQTTGLNGSAWAHNTEQAEWAIIQLTTALELSLPLRTRRSHQSEKFLGVMTNNTDNVPAFVTPSGEAITSRNDQFGMFQQLDFSDEYESVLTGEACIIECEVSEEIEFSGLRHVTQTTASGRDLIQVCGMQAGRRTVRGAVKATNETTAMAWAKRQYYLPFMRRNEDDTDPATRYRTPPRIDCQPGFVSMVDGVFRFASGAEGVGSPPPPTDENITAVRVGFSFEEVLTNFDYEE